MTSSTAVKIGCLAALSLTVSLPGLSAPRFTAAEQPLGSIAPIVFSNADLVGGTTKGYRPWFENGSWQGDLVEYTVTASGGLSTSVSFAQSSPTNTGSNWSALVNFAAREEADADYWDTGRKIITFNSSTNAQVPFRFTDAGIGAANKALLDSTAEDGASNILDFVRGDRGNEYPEGAQLRHRTSILGDIIHSRPVYVGPPNDIRPESGYAKFAKDNAGRARRVYVGANDGMLHVFDAANGNEVYAYVPSMLMDKLRVLTARPYPHAYYVDGEMSVRDVQIDDKWRTVLAGSLGAGGRGFFVLDITDPNLTSETANSGDDKKVLFEYSGLGEDLVSESDDDPDLGDSFSRPAIAKLNDGDWYVITGNGYNSENGVAMLYLVNLDTLELTTISTGSGTKPSPNGLSSPSLLDTNRDGKADYAYAGDIDGNLWKFDLKSSSANAWKVAYDGAPLHPKTGKQAITQAPQIALHPRYGYMIYFATGRLYTTGDLTDTSIQSLYGIWDSGKTPPANQSLLKQTWDGPKTYDYRDKDNNAANQTIAIYNPDAGNANWDTHHGWKVDFPAGGYRVLQPVQVRANRVKATVYKPTVGQQGENWLVEAVLTDGGPNPPAAPIYDLNVDRQLKEDDLYTMEGDADAKVPMMWRQVDGIMSQVTIGAIASGIDTLFINYLQPSVPSEPCTENCPAGFFNGHIDVQTYLSAGANATPRGSRYTGHAHVYDKLMARVYVDFFDITTANPTNANLQNHVEIDSTGAPFLPASGIRDDDEFIVLVANADFSPGGTLHIGNREWNVLDYQIRIHKALKEWDPGLSSYPVDDGERLVFTWGEIKEAGGTIKLSFNDRAILDGGLHPTQSQCVITNATGGILDNVALPITYNPATKIGRWRNGALTIQLVRKSYFTGPGPALAMVDIQKPLDLAPYVITDKGAVLTTSIDDNNDGDTEDEYEQIGGLLAQNDAEHLWESTVFWHFGDLSKFTSLGAPCYYPPFPNKDDPKYKTWAEAVALEQDNDPITATLAKRGDDLTAETLAAAIDALEAKGCDDAQAACNGEYKIFKSILALSDDYLQAPDDVDDSDADSDAPVVIEGGSTGAGLEGDGGDGAITEGSTFRTGRMSWTDIVK